MLDKEEPNELNTDQKEVLSSFEDSTKTLAISGQSSPQIEILIGYAFEDFVRDIKDDLDAEPPVFVEGEFDPVSDERFQRLVTRLVEYGAYMEPR